jgi:hypothetical protein
MGNDRLGYLHTNEGTKPVGIIDLGEHPNLLNHDKVLLDFAPQLVAAGTLLLHGPNYESGEEISEAMLVLGRRPAEPGFDLVTLADRKNGPITGYVATPIE